MGVWFYLYLIINIIILIYYYKKKLGIFQAPFLMAYTSIFVLLPQLSSIYISPFYEKYLIRDLGIIMATCNLTFILGFEIAKKQKITSSFFSSINYRKSKYILFIFTILGLYSMTLWNDTFQGSDNVIQANLKNFSQYAFCAIVTFIFRKNKSKYLYLLIICTLVPLIYFAFFIKGSRGESLFLLITISFILSMKYPQKHKLISKSIFTILIIGAMLNASITVIRHILVGNSNNENNSTQELVLWEAFKTSFIQKDITVGMDLGNAAKGIRYLKETGQMDYGTSIWDTFIQNYIPRRLVGEEAKENLKLNIVNDKSTIQKLTYNITTMTGYYSAFKCFSYLGFFLFGIIGYLYGYFWRRICKSQICLFIYLSIIATIPLIFNHGVDYLYTRLIFIFLIIYPLSYYSIERKKIKASTKFIV